MKMALKPKKLEFYQYDRGVPYLGNAKNSDGTLVDLTGATIYCTMIGLDDRVVEIARQTAGITIDADQVNNKGQFKYDWQATETDNDGDYEIRFEVNPAVGEKFTLPNPSGGKALVRIVPSIDGE